MEQAEVKDLRKHNINMMNTLKFDKKCICGPEFVCLRIIDNCDELKVGSIYLPSTSKLNERLAHCIIEDVGSKAAEEYGLKAGEYVLIDRASTFAHTAPVCLCRYNNVICKTNADKSDFWPLRNMLFVQPEKDNGTTNVGGIIVSSHIERLNLGIIIKSNIDEKLNVPFKDGDYVMLTKGADVVQLGETILYIYKHNMIICTVQKDS